MAAAAYPLLDAERRTLPNAPPMPREALCSPLLRGTTVFEAWPTHEWAPEKMVKLGDDATVGDALHLLSKHALHAVPVVSKVSGAVVGFVDVVDVLDYVVRCRNELLQQGAKQAAASTLHSLHSHAMLAQKLDKLVDFSHRDPMVPLHAESPMSELVRHFAVGIHRVPIFDVKQASGVLHMLGVVSQYDLVMALAPHLRNTTSSLHALGALTVEKLGLHNNSIPIRTIRDSATVSEALDVLRRGPRVNCVAVVDANGKLVGNFSASDCKRMFDAPLVSLLEQSVSSFLSSKSPRSLQPVTVTQATDFATVCCKLTDHRIRAVWLTDAAHKPLAVVTLTDVARIVRDFVA